MNRNPPPPRRMVHSVMSEMRDEIDLKLKGRPLTHKSTTDADEETLHHKARD